MNLNAISCLTAVGLLLTMATASISQTNSRLESAASSTPTQIRMLVEESYPHLQKLYEHLHTNPELSFHETQTAARIAAELRNLGYQVTTDVGGHGVVGIMKNGNGPAVMVRTDLDALPVTENTGLPYASKVKVRDDDGNEVGVMHACGHDIHMTAFIGTAHLLSKLQANWSGTILFVAQPAEERGSGARKMLGDGLFTRFPRPDYALALHCSASLPAGQIGFCAGYALANVDMVDVIIRGVGGHGAYPHTTKDPVVIAAQVVLALQTIVSREIKPTEPAVVTVGSIHGGTKHNVIPDEVKLQLTLRSYTDEVRAQTIAAIRRIVKGIAEAAGVPADRMPEVRVGDEYTPATYNDPELTARLVPVFQQVLGAANVLKNDPVMGGEDFSQYGRTTPKVPIFIYWLGTVDPKKYEASAAAGTPLPSLHSNLFAPLPKPTILTGVQAMTAAALELLAR